MNRLSDAEFVVWLGAGITPRNTTELMCHLVRRLRQFSAEGVPEADIALVKLNQQLQAGGIDIDAASIDLDDLDQMSVLGQHLRDGYAAVMQEVGKELPAKMSLECDVLEIPTRYSTTDPPEPVHVLLVLLMLEGMFDEVVTTNWDDMLEKAFEALGHNLNPRVVVRDEDLVDAAAPILLKIHGCARRARHNADERKLITVRTSQIRDRIVKRGSMIESHTADLLSRRSSLFVGMSAQDEDIQIDFLKSELSQLTLPDGTDDYVVNPRLAFTAKGSLLPSQTDLLQAFYGDHDFRARKAEIEASAAVALWADELFGSLYIAYLRAKADWIVASAAVSHFSVAQMELCAAFLEDAEAVALAYCDAGDSKGWARVGSDLSEVVSGAYRVLTHQPQSGPYCAALPGSMYLVDAPRALLLGLHTWVLALAALAEAASNVGASLHIDPDSKGLVVQSGGAIRHAFVVKQPLIGDAQLALQALTDDASSIIVFLEGGPPTEIAFTPDSEYPGMGEPEPQRLYVRDLVAPGQDVQPLKSVFEAVCS